MFFPDRIKGICPSDRVLEVGPGGTPHPRSNVFLEKIFESEKVVGQRGYAPPLRDDREVIFYEGGSFPFINNDFDYVICSHVLEHVEDIDFFVSEISRVAKKGYLEFPTIYYDFIYNFPEHITLLFHNNDTIFWMPKIETGLSVFKPVNDFFYESLKSGYDDLVDPLKDYFFQGFEWENSIKTQRVEDIKFISFEKSALNFNRRSNFSIKMFSLFRKIVGKIGF